MIIGFAAVLRTILRYWLPVAVWAAMIVTASGSGLSTGNTTSMLGRVLASLLGHSVPEDLLYVPNIMIRKSAHLTEFGILSVLAFRAVRGDRKGFRLSWALSAIAISAGVAGIDEIRQSFVPERTGSVWDALLDTAGATVGQLVTRLVSRED